MFVSILFHDGCVFWGFEGCDETGRREAKYDDKRKSRRKEREGKEEETRKENIFMDEKRAKAANKIQMHLSHLCSSSYQCLLSCKPILVKIY